MQASRAWYGELCTAAGTSSLERERQWPGWETQRLQPWTRGVELGKGLLMVQAALGQHNQEKHRKFRFDVAVKHLWYLTSVLLFNKCFWRMQLG